MIEAFFLGVKGAAVVVVNGVHPEEEIEVLVLTRAFCSALCVKVGFGFGFGGSFGLFIGLPYGQ
jgi:hypothetical protein